MRLPLCEAPTCETRPDHNTGNFIPYMINAWCGTCILLRSSYYFATSIQTVKVSLKRVNLCTFTAWCPDVLADKPQPQFEMKILRKKGVAYMPVFTVCCS